MAAITLSRNVLTPGHPDRDWFHCWTVDYDLFSHQHPRGELVAANGIRTSLKQFYPRPWAWTEPFNSAFRLLDPIAPGSYRFVLDGDDVGAVTVTARQAPMTLIKGGSLSYLQGYDIELSPGTYKLTQPLRLPAGRRLHGYGARIVIDAKAKQYGGWDDIVFQSIGDGAEIKGIEFIFPNQFCPQVNGLLLADCKFKSNNWKLDGQAGAGGGLVGISGRDNLVLNCEFSQGAGAGGDGGTSFVGCKFEGLPDGNTHAFVCNGNTAPLMLYDCIFDGCDRGPVIRPSVRDCTDVFVSHLNCRNINRMGNGCEIICGDAGRFSFKRCIWNNVRVSNCASLFQVDANMFDCRLHGVIADDLEIYFRDGYQHERNYLWNSEIRNGSVYFGDGARDNRLFWCGFIGYRLKTGNQFWCHPNEYAGKTKAAIVERLPNANNIESNTFELPPGVAEIQRR